MMHRDTTRFGANSPQFLRHNYFVEVVIDAQAATSFNEDTWADTSTATHFVYKADGATVRLRKRQAYPATFAQVHGTVLLLGYGAVNQARRLLAMPLSAIPEAVFMDDEFLYIAIDLATREVIVQSDAFPTVPLFVSADTVRFVLASDFSVTHANHKTKQYQVNTRAVAQFLGGHSNFGATFVHDIRVLYDRKRLVWSNGNTNMYMPPDASMRDYHSNRTGDPHQFVPLLEQTLDRYWQRYVGNGHIGGSELSGGLDSAVITACLADKGYRPMTITSILPGKFRVSQQQKLDDFARRFGTTGIALPAHHYFDYPWQDVLDGRTSQPFYHYEYAMYATEIDVMYQQLRQCGSLVIFRGVGGDELFEHVDYDLMMNNDYSYADEYLAVPGFEPIASHLTNPASNPDGKLPSKQPPVPLMSLSALESPLFATAALRNDLWPVSPLADPRLVAYTQTLPLEYCDNKLLFGIYARARRIPQSIYLASVNEDFRDVNVARYFGLHQHITQALQDSVLRRMGLIRVEPLWQAHHDAGKTQTIHSRMAIALVQVLYAELSLRSLGIR
jgi:hypothetical protein